MESSGRNCSSVAFIILIFLIFSVLSLAVFLPMEKREIALNSFQDLIRIQQNCTSRNGSSSIEDSKACNCTSCVNQSMTAPQVIVKEKVIEKPCEREGPWYAQNTVWHYPSLFPRCSMDVCFNYSRCQNMDDIKIFVYDLPTRRIWFFERMNSTKWITKDPNEACLFLVYVDVLNPYGTSPPPHPNTLPHWNGGKNHVLVSFSDRWSLTGMAMESIGMASLLTTDMHQTIYRPGFDISLIFPPYIRSTHFQKKKPFDRKYFLTFRGLRYLGHEGEEGLLRSYDSFRNMHNGKDIIVATSCRHPNNDELRQNEPSLGANCNEDEAIYDSFDYVDLMNSTFGLAPAGRQPNSYRFTEILSAGAQNLSAALEGSPIPVLIADNYVKPFDTLILWHRCILQFPIKEMHRILPILRKISKKEAERRQKYCLEIYREFLKDDITLCKSAVTSLKARMMGFFSNYAETGEN